MKNSVMLTITSLLLLLFLTFHLAGDIVYGWEPGGLANLIMVVPFSVVWLGVGVASRLANTSGHFFFVWTLLAIGVLGLFSVILSVRGLWSLPWRRSR